MNHVLWAVIGCLFVLIATGVILRLRARKRRPRFSTAVPQHQDLWPEPESISGRDYELSSRSNFDHAFPQGNSSGLLSVDIDAVRFPSHDRVAGSSFADRNDVELEGPSDGPVVLRKGPDNGWRSGLYKSEDADRIRYYDDGSLRRGRELGSGGQGAVYELVERDREVEKRFLIPLQHGAREFEELLRKREAVEAALAACPIHLCWPESPVLREEVLTGYIMPRIPDRFYFEMKFGNSGVKRRERELQHAIPRKSTMRLPFEVDDLERFELVYLIARFLDAMHRNGVVYGDISWVNFTFSLEPTELCVLDFDSSRIQGSLPFTRVSAIDTPDWEDPEWSGSVVTRVDSDRYKFALLAYRMLVAKSLDATIDDDFEVPLMEGSDREQLCNLWMRSRGPAGTRPQISEWLNVLESVRV